MHSLRVFSRTILFPPTRYIEHMNGNFTSLTRPNVRAELEKVSIDYQYRSYSFPQRLQRLSKAVVAEPVKRKPSEFIWFKLISNRHFNGENFFSLSIFVNLGWKNIRLLQACVYASIRQRFRTVHLTGYRSFQEIMYL